MILQQPVIEAGESSNGDLISREQIYTQVYKMACDCASAINGICSHSLETAAHMIEEAPAADAVPVVRCKDCISSEMVKCRKGDILYCNMHD